MVILRSIILHRILHETTALTVITQKRRITIKSETTLFFPLLGNQSTSIDDGMIPCITHTTERITNYASRACRVSRPRLSDIQTDILDN